MNVSLFRLSPIPLLMLLIIIFLTGCASSNSNYKEQSLDFVSANKRLSGFLMLPNKGEKPFPLLVFVHGDGATPYDAFGYYPYLWRHLAERGIASFSWHKAGVKSSEGSWLKQSMHDRADEVIAAIDMLKQRDDIAHNKIGLIGFSQGGWVLPLVAKKSAYPDYMVIVSGAINWLDQGDYLTKKRLQREGFSSAQIQQALRCNQLGLQVLQPTTSYAEYLHYENTLSPQECKPFATSPMSKARFEFVKLNVNSDAREGLATIQIPTLAVFGDKDINVDFTESIGEYQRIFKASGNIDLTTKVFPNAQHSLFKNKYIDANTSGVSSVIKMEVLGEKIFTEGYLNFVTNWVEQVSQ